LSSQVTELVETIFQNKRWIKSNSFILTIC